MSERPRNAILSRLPDDEWQSVAPHLVPVRLRMRQILYEAGQEMEALYFPEDCMLSHIAVLDEGFASEGALVGPQGVVDVHALPVGSLSPARIDVQIPGVAHRLSVEQARELVLSSPQLLRGLQLWSNYAMAQALQTAACNTAHGMRSRLARWLLEVADQLDSKEFPVTQEFLAEMVGVTRPSVSEIAQEFQTDGAVRYARGHLTITDRRALEERACECYRDMRDRFAALFGQNESHGPGRRSI